MLPGGSFIVTWEALPPKGQLLTNRLTSVWRPLCPLPCIVLKKNVAHHSLCTEQRLKANLRSTVWAAEHISRVLIAWPHILDSVPKMNVRGALHIASPSIPEPDWEARGGLLNTCYVQLLRPCTASMLRRCGGVYTVPKPGTLMCVLIHPVCQFPPPSPPLTLLRWLCGN